MKAPDGEIHFHSADLPAEKSGVLLSVTRGQAGWETINYLVRRLAKGETWHGKTEDEELALVTLGGRLSVDWGDGPRIIGDRPNVFAGYPHAAYLPCQTSFKLSALTTCEFADARVPSTAHLNPRVVAPPDCRLEIRGGGNATRQIIDIIPAGFPADRLLVCEVFTPSGNWSSYPPHKHDVHNPPAEVDLDEIYYYRIDHPDGYGFQRLYDSAGTRDETRKVVDGDLILIKDGYHPFVTAPGYNAYYLNVLAGSARSFASSDDPKYAHLRKSWPEPDPRVPLVHPEPAKISGGTRT